MPIYEYRCDDCAGTFERLLPMAQREGAQDCPRCASDHTRVVVSSFAMSGVASGDDAALATGGGCCGGSCGCGCAN